MNSHTIRQKFLDFFKNKDHKIVPSAPIVVKDDPSLMFVNAGMNQFKDYFLGNKEPDHPRVADTQKCLRVSGKHNDLEEVGIDTYHHTMFEMLGNWSFGDYFKKETIAWSWKLLTDVFGISPDRLYATVFEGDQQDGLEADSEAYNYWKEIISEDRLLYGDKTDNFWEMGDTGPCGPCSEIHVDLRTDEERQKIPGKDLVNQDHPFVIELWNLVFIQFNRLADGSLEPLPQQHIDTGMGFERLVLALQNKSSNYDTDIFQPSIQFIEEQSGKKYGDNKDTDIAIRVLADHIRAVSFTIADGQLPSNNKAGYVIRRILRRAVRYAYTHLGFDKPFFYRLTNIIAEQYKDIFPELKQQEDFVQRVIHEEEASFLKTLETGLKRFDKELTSQGIQEGDTFPGSTAFELYDTYGFPYDLTALIAREKGLKMDEQGFNEEMKKQKERSKQASAVDAGDWVILNEGSSKFLGYDQIEADAKIIRYREVTSKKGTLYHVVLDQTPFYAESGGQIGDTGILEDETKAYKVIDTKKENDLILHYMKELPEDLNKTFRAKVDKERRERITMNHTATHLLHAALKEVLGDHVEQKGSFVGDEELRFDFSHFTQLTEDELNRVESIVNEKIRENIDREEYRSIPFQEALNMGATALFGEKYGDNVRMITFDPDYSRELCGGTHVEATGDIGLLKIVSEGSVAAGVRRIVAVTGQKAEEYIAQQMGLIGELKEMLKHPKDLKQAVNNLMEERSKLKKQVESLEHQQVEQMKESLIQNSREESGRHIIIEKISLPSGNALKQLAFDIQNKLLQLYPNKELFLVLAANVEGKPQIAVLISESLAERENLDAAAIAKELGQHIKGGGGGKATFATAGGKEAGGLDKVVQEAPKYLSEKVK